MSEWRDLTQPIHESIPVRPLHEQPSFEDYMTLEGDGTNSTLVHIETHVGTHMDSPAHFLPADSNRTIDELTPEEMIGEGVLFDFSHKKPGAKIDLNEIKSKVDQHNIKAEDFFILKLGLDPQNGEDYLHNYNYLSDEAVEYLLEEDIGCLASEALNVDQSGQPVEEHTVHYLLLEADVFIVEGITNLDDLSEGRYDVVCTPLPYVGRDGSQIRFLVRSQDP